LGRKRGVVADWMQRVAAAPSERKRDLGRLANSLKRELEQRWEELKEQHHARPSAADRLDVTLPGRRVRLGHPHPLTLIREQLEEIFTRMGFAIVEGPEAEDEWHCFDALNMPSDHPARDMQDTLYLSESVRGDGVTDVRTLLRTHTSSMQTRYMQSHAPPI